MGNNLLDEALKMPPNERIEFAQLIMASIDCEEDKFGNSGWMKSRTGDKPLNMDVQN